jgi:methionyl-tRNA formyltransferase
MKTLLIVGNKRGYLFLKALVEGNTEVVGVISLRQHTHELERYEGRIKALALKHGIPHFETVWMKDRDYVQLITKDLRPDITFIVGCRILIPREIYEYPRLGTLAIHDSLLPEYRGFAPMNWALLNGEDHVGVTLFYLNEQMDGGDIVAQKRIPIASSESVGEIADKVCEASVCLIVENLSGLERELAPRRKQDYVAGSFACARTPEDGYIDWSCPTQYITNQVRALGNPFPGAFTFYEGSRLILWKATALTNPRRYVGRVPGRVVGMS